MTTLLPLHPAEYSLLYCGGAAVGVLLLDPGSGVLHARFRDDIADNTVALWARELPAVAEELGGAEYFRLIQDRLSNALQAGDAEHAYVREFPPALARLYERRVAGTPRAGPRSLPLYTLRAAATRFGEDMDVEPEDMLPAPEGLRITPDTFAVHVVGRSMEPAVPAGSIAVFRRVTGSRQGLRVLVWRRGSAEAGGEFTLKVYSSEKRITDGGWEHGRIVLRPLNPDFEPVVLDEGGEYRVVGELVTVLALEDTV